jgi:dTDP-4-amino-4,6-dideoxygalactose transaminase
MTESELPFLTLGLGDDRTAVESAIRRVIDRGWFILGPEVEAFEREFAAASGSARAVGVGTGTDAIALTLRALGVGPGDEVVTTPLSAAYTTLAIMMAGARPIFADIDADRLTLDPAAARAAVTSRTVAILPVHLYGQPADMPALADVAERYSLAIVEDCCQAHLATCGGRPIGTFGVAGAFSFYPTKNLGALGDGGAVCTNDAQLAERLRRLRNGGQVDRYHHVDAGVNSRLDELQAAVLRARLPYLAGWTTRRRTLAALYRTGLRQASVNVPAQYDVGHVYHLFPIRTPARPALQAHLMAEGIGTLIHYPVTIPTQQAFASGQAAKCPVAARVADEVLSLPLYPSLADADAARVADAVCAFKG